MTFDHTNLDCPSSYGEINSLRLHDVNLRSNNIAEIPDEVGALKQLNTLSLAHNCLERRLPEHLGLLTRLTDLDISSNNIGYLPPSLGALEVSHVTWRTSWFSIHSKRE